MCVYELELSRFHRIKQAFIKASKLNYGIFLLTILLSSSLKNSMDYVMLIGISFCLSPLYHYLRLRKDSKNVFFYSTYLENGKDKIYYKDMTRHQFLKMRNGNHQLKFRVNKEYYCFTFSEMGMDLIKPLLKNY